MKQEPTTLDVVPFLWWILSGVVFGFLAGFLINYFIPVEYSSRAVLASSEAPGIRSQLSLVQARLVSEEIGGKESPEAVRAGTVLLTTEEGLEITTRFSRRETARDVARAAASFVASPELAMKLSDSSRPDPVLIKDCDILRGILAYQAQKSGFVDFREVPVLASRGSEKARKLLINEDFSRRLKRYTEIITQIGDWDLTGSRLKSKMIVEPETANEPASAPYTETLVSMSTYLGTLLGVAGGFIFARKPKAASDPEPQGPPIFASSPADSGEW